MLSERCNYAAMYGCPLYYFVRPSMGARTRGKDPGRHDAPHVDVRGRGDQPGEGRWVRARCAYVVLADAVHGGMRVEDPEL